MIEVGVDIIVISCEVLHDTTPDSISRIIFTMSEKSEK
jgi:hypothetical protein